MAGYHRDMHESVLAINEGVSRRFPFRWQLSNYDSRTMLLILEQHLSNMNFKAVLSSAARRLFVDTAERHAFPNGAGDVENLASAVTMYASSHGVSTVYACTLLSIIDNMLRSLHGTTLRVENADLC